MAKILLTGGTGLIGTHLQKLFNENDHEVVILTRSPKNDNHFKWDIHKKFIDEKAFIGVDYIIHLAGAGIADSRWTAIRKKELIDSRVLSADLLYSYVKKLNIKLKGFISASGIGFYGAINSDHIFTEKDAPENDFISKICIKWENAADQFEQIDIPVTCLRTGVVLSAKGGALEKMNTPLFLSALGTGKQYVPWIHINDLCGLYLKAIEDSNFKGIYNAVAPEHQTNLNFTKKLGKTLKKPVMPFNVPEFMLKIILGEMAVIILKGSRISSQKTTTKYKFEFSNLDEALLNIYNKKS